MNQKPLDNQYLAAAYFLLGKPLFLFPLAIKPPLISTPPHLLLSPEPLLHMLSGLAMSLGAWVLKWLLSWPKEWPNHSVQQRPPLPASQSAMAVSWLPCPTPSGLLQLEQLQAGSCAQHRSFLHQRLQQGYLLCRYHLLAAGSTGHPGLRRLSECPHLYAQCLTGARKAPLFSLSSLPADQLFSIYSCLLPCH